MFLVGAYKLKDLLEMLVKDQSSKVSFQNGSVCQEFIRIKCQFNKLVIYWFFFFAEQCCLSPSESVSKVHQKWIQPFWVAWRTLSWARWRMRASWACWSARSALTTSPHLSSSVSRVIQSALIVSPGSTTAQHAEAVCVMNATWLWSKSPGN